MKNSSLVGGEKEEYTKILIKYYRQLENHPDANNLHFDFMLFGYFDSMSFKEVNNIEEYYKDSPTKVDSFQQNYEIQRLCIYRKNNSSLNIFEKDAQRPFIVITELKINEDVLNSIPDKREKFLETCYNIINGKVEELSIDTPIRYQTYFSLGYSDIAVVFRADEFQSVANLVLNLRYLPYVSSTCGKRSMFKSSYSVSGVRSDSIKNINSEKTNNVSIRFSLRNSEGYEEIRKSVLKQLTVKERSPGVFTVFGKYDLELKIDDIPLKVLIKFFQSQTYKELDKKYLGHTNTHWLLDCPLIKMKKKTNNNDLEYSNHKININWIRKTDLQNAFHKIVQTLYQLERNDASEKTLINELSKVITGFNEQAREGYNSIKDNNSTLLQEHYENMRNGMELITKLINSNVQSFRFYTEMPSYDIQIVKSATKLYLLYKNIVEEIENIINASNNVKRIKLFVILGYFGTVNQTVLFPQASKILVAIDLSIDSFFHIPYNLLLLCHEISHSIPTPEGTEYQDTIVSILSNQVSTLITSKMVMGHELLEPKLFTEEIDRLFFAMKDDFGKFIKERITSNQYYKKNRQNIDKVFIDCLEDEINFYNGEVERTWNHFVDEWNSLKNKNFLSTNKKVIRLENVINAIKESLIYGREIDSQMNLFRYLLIELKIENDWQDAEYKELQGAWTCFLDSVAAVKNGKIEEWEKFICDKWLPKINEINYALTKLDLCDCSILDCLSYHHILEATKDNARAIVGKIFLYLSEVKPIIKNSIKNDIKIINEFTADYWMCELLNLRWEIYDEMIRNYEKENNEWIDIEELEIRKRMMQMAGIFTKKHQISGDKKHFEDYDQMLENIQFSSYINYLDTIKKKNNSSKTIESDSISVLKKYFHELDPNEISCQKSFSKHIQLIEYFAFIREKKQERKYFEGSSK